jgi:hypothetical protein
VKDSRAGDPFAPEFFRLQRQAVIAFPQNGAFSRIVNQDDGLLAGTSRSRHQVGFDAQAFEFGAVDSGGVVVADFADVSGSHSPLLAGGDGSSNLATRQDVRRVKFNLGPEGRMVRNQNKRVGGIQPDADNVNLGRGGHGVPGRLGEFAEVCKNISEDVSVNLVAPRGFELLGQDRPILAD